MEQCWRWFGPEDAVRLEEARQAGARGIVTALHHVPYGAVWSFEEIEKRKAEVMADPSLGLSWRVVESLPVHEDIKRGEGDLSTLFANYRQSLANLAAAGLEAICYNFMPVLDWTRTELAAPLPGGGGALRFEMMHYAAVDVFMLERPGATEGIAPEVLARAKAWYDASSEDDRLRLMANIMAGLPGAYDRYDVAGLKDVLARWSDVTAETLRANYRRFLEEVVPTAEDLGVRLCVHPDDPPRPLFGLPRIVSTADDIAWILNSVDSPANGLTLCAGSLGAHPHNDVPEIARRFAEKIHFAHLRNVAKEPDGSFQEADHLGGDTDMVALIRVLLSEEKRRRDVGRPDHVIPMRPDHGHLLADDFHRKAHPGYSLIGRLRGLAELRGVMTALEAMGIA